MDNAVLTNKCAGDLGLIYTIFHEIWVGFIFIIFTVSTPSFWSYQRVKIWQFGKRKIWQFGKEKFDSLEKKNLTVFTTHSFLSTHSLRITSLDNPLQLISSTIKVEQSKRNPSITSIIPINSTLRKEYKNLIHANTALTNYADYMRVEKKTSVVSFIFFW